MRVIKFVVLTLLTIVAVKIAAMAAPAPEGNAPVTLDQVIDRIVQREAEEVKTLEQYSPVVETYIQRMRSDGELQVPSVDEYFISKLNLKDNTFDNRVFNVNEGMAKGLKNKVFGRLSPVSVKFSPAGFAYEIYPDQSDFDRQHYDFTFLQREFLGEVRTLVFDVAPKKDAGKGRFLGRIWVEDKDYNIVRFNGTYVPKPRSAMFFHFDSWRINVTPTFWAPTYIYSEESNALYGINQHMAFKAQTRIWGYNSKGSGKASEFSDILVESSDAKDHSASATDASPLEGKRAFERMAAENVIGRMERAGLIAPAGELEKVLQTVVNNLEITSKLDIQPEIRCRVLLTTPLESFSVGHTIILSRGLLDVLPDEGSLAMVLARELAHIAEGHHFDTKYAFSDRLQFADENTYQNMMFKHTPQEEQAADAKATEYLKNSPYGTKMAAAGLFLRQLDNRAASLPALTKARLGTSLVNEGRVAHMTDVMNAGPQLELNKLDQIAALPLGGRIKLNPWDNSVVMVKTMPMPITSAADKMPFEVTPFLPHIQRLGTDNSLATAAAK